MNGKAIVVFSIYGMISSQDNLPRYDSLCPVSTYFIIKKAITYPVKSEKY